jgi:hypothetical protein
MRKILYFLIPGIVGAGLFASCNGSTSSGSNTADTLSMPYKASYSSSYTISDNSKNVQLVLKTYKAWETGKVSDAAAYFADTVAVDLANGEKYQLSRDSLLKITQGYRDEMSSSKINMISIVNLHSKDHNQDWVSVWYKQVDVQKNGEADSAFYNDLNHIQNGKIDYVTTFRQGLQK